MRRRLLSIVGALGLMTGLLSSGVAAQAATTAGPDSTYNSLLWAFSSSSHDVCYSNIPGGAVSGAGTCTITQTPSGKANIAVCVQSSNAPMASQTCSISQMNDTHNNYALVIQRINQNTCALTGDCQTGSQAASIEQENGSGWNFGGAFQNTSQSIGQRDDDPIQTNTQHVAVLTPSDGPGGLEQSSTSGSNFGAVSQSSAQSAFGDSSQTQTAEQVAGSSGLSRSGIDQNAPGGSNAALLINIQKQQLDASPSQTQTASQDGDITQNGVAGKNLASGTQLQDQLERGPIGAVQHQTGGPRCCSFQNGGQFFVKIATRQFGNHIAPSAQTEFIAGNCDSYPSSAPNGCHTSLSATQQGVTTSDQCSGTNCHRVISCFEGVKCAAGGGGG